MAESASQLNLEILSQTPDNHILKPSQKKIPLYKRPTSRIFFFFMVASVAILFLRWVIGIFEPIYYILLVIIIPLLYSRREAIKDVYIFKDGEIKVPYTWLYRKSIPLEDVVKVVDDTITDQEAGTEYAAIRIILDTPLLKYNITGLQPPNILLSTMKYDSHDMNAFADLITRKNREVVVPPNTLAQRLTDQVNRAWHGRWKLVFLNSIDSTSEAALYLLVIDAFLLGTLTYSIWPYLGGLILGLYFLGVFLLHFFDRPQAIIGIRPHEQSPLIYNEEDIITTVRFMVITYPYTLDMMDCEIIYNEDATKQVSRLHQIEPGEIEPGELTYGVAQFLGNHTKSTGAKLQFSYKERSEDKEEPEIVYEIEIKWA